MTVDTNHEYYKCVCGGEVDVTGLHYIFYPEPDVCCQWWRCETCGKEIKECDGLDFKKEFKEVEATN